MSGHTNAIKDMLSKAKKKPLGEGSRFKAVEASAAASGADDPAAVAAAAGRAAHGAKAMAKWSAAGRKG